MFDRSSDDFTPAVVPSIYLEYGVDEEACDDKEFKICERGMCFKSRWQFELGTELAISLASNEGDGQFNRIHAQGTIVGCERVSPKCYQITLLFVDFPDELRPAIHAIASRLERASNTAHIQAK